MTELCSVCTVPSVSADDRVRVIQPGDGRVILLVVAHADDPALFIGGTIAAWADAGWRVVVVRVTDDRWDSVGLTEAETIERNSVEFRDAAAVLGIRPENLKMVVFRGRQKIQRGMANQLARAAQDAGAVAADRPGRSPVRSPGRSGSPHGDLAVDAT